MSIRVSKNDASILRCMEKMFNIYIDGHGALSITVVKQKCGGRFSEHFGCFLAQISRPELKGYQETFYPKLRKIYRLSGVRNLKSLLLSVPRELRVRRGGKCTARKSGSPQLFSSPILVINFQVVQQRPGTQERCYRRCSRTRRVVTQGTGSQPSAHTNVDLPRPILHVTTSDCGRVYVRDSGVESYGWSRGCINISLGATTEIKPKCSSFSELTEPAKL